MDVIHEQQGGNRMNQQEFDDTNEVVIGAKWSAVTQKMRRYN